MASLRKTLFETLRMFSYTHTLSRTHTHAVAPSPCKHTREPQWLPGKETNLIKKQKHCSHCWNLLMATDYFPTLVKASQQKSEGINVSPKNKQTNRKQSISEIVLNNWIEKRERKWWKLENTTKFHRKRTKTRSDPNRTVRQNNLREIEIYWFRGLL